MGCEGAQICSLTMFHVSHPYLVSLSFYTIPTYMPLFYIRRIINLLVIIISCLALRDQAILIHVGEVTLRMQCSATYTSDLNL